MLLAEIGCERHIPVTVVLPRRLRDRLNTHPLIYTSAGREYETENGKARPVASPPSSPTPNLFNFLRYIQLRLLAFSRDT